MKKDFLYFINDDRGYSYIERPNGNIELTSLPNPLRSTPDGWQEISIKYQKSQDNIGVFRAYTLPLKAVEDGGRIIKHIFYTQGRRAKAFLVVLKLNRDTDIHEPYFMSAIDFTQFLDADYGATVTILEAGLLKMIRANYNTKYSIPIDVPEAVTLWHDGIVLRGNAQFVITNGDSFDLIRSHTVDMTRVEGEGNTYVFGLKDTNRVNLVNGVGSTVYNTGQWFLQPTVGDDVLFDYDITAKVTRLDIAPAPSASVNFIVTLRVQQGATVLLTEDLYRVDGPTDVYGINILAGKTHHITGTRTLNIPAGAQVYLLSSVGPIDSVLGDINSTIDYLNDEPNLMKVNFKSRYQPTEMKVLRPEYVFKKLIEFVSGGKYTVDNAFLDILRVDLADFTITSGDGVRGLEGAEIKTSLSDFLKSYDSSFALGLGVTDTAAFIQREKFFYADNHIIDLGEVRDLQVTSANEHVFNEVHVGSPNATYDDVNGREEFNTTFKFKTPDDSEESRLDLVSIYRKDGYGIEFERINLTNKQTTDSDSDNEVFMINIAPITQVVQAAFDDTFNFITVNGYFQSVFAGSQITVSGSSSNDGTYTIASVTQDVSSTTIFVNEPLTDEPFSQITIQANKAVLNRPKFDSITGVLEPATVYNVLLSPKRALLAHGPYLRSGLDLSDEEFITFLNADKNDKLVTVDNGVTISEKANELIGSMPGGRLFRPVYFQFFTEVPLNLVMIMELTARERYGKIKLWWKGQPYYGYVVECGQVPQLNPAQSWKLLCAPETNLLPLIKAQ